MLEWLLEQENPSARYLALRWVLGRPEDEAEVSAARAAVPGWGPARAILDAQWPAGYWVAPGPGYSPRHKATVWQILFLAALGVPLNAALGARANAALGAPIERACDYLLTHSRRADGRFVAGKTARGATACLNGSLLWAMFRLGCQDPRLEESLQALAAMVRRDRFRCRFLTPHSLETSAPCATGAVKVLAACTEAPTGWQSPEIQEMAGEAIALLVNRDESGAQPLLTGGQAPSCRQDARWQQLGFPPTDEADLVEALEVLGRADAPPPSGLQEALALIHARRGPDGVWRLDHTPDNTWASFGMPGQPNKWVTIRALTAVRRWEEMG